MMTTRKNTVKTKDNGVMEAAQDTPIVTAPTTATADVFTLLRVLFYNSWVIVLVTLIGGAASFAFVRSQTPVYESYTTLIVSPRINLDQGRTLESIRVLQQNVVGTYVQVLRSSSVRNAAIETLQGQHTPDALNAAEIEVRPVENSTVLTITVRSENPVLARDLADAIATNAVINNPVPSLNQAYPLQILDAAVVPEDPASPQGMVNIALGVAGSLVLSVGLAFLVEEFKKRRRSA
jgi:capsular polysaccharide biosynthesis protein